MTIFRPCIDIHEGQVKQIVGGSLNDQGAKTNFVSQKNAAWYAELYQQHQLKGGHVISLGKGNQEQAMLALQAWPQGLQYGGGVTLENAASYLEAGASHIIVTSWLFEDNAFSWQRLEALVKEVGKDRLVLDLSCRKVEDSWFIATNRWQTVTNTEVSAENLLKLSQYCDEFLIHAADVEGLQAGIDGQLVSFLATNSPIAMTYAGGARNIKDLEEVKSLSQGQVDLTIGSALDIFGGDGISLEACIAFNQQQKA